MGFNYMTTLGATALSLSRKNPSVSLFSAKSVYNLSLTQMELLRRGLKSAALEA